MDDCEKCGDNKQKCVLSKLKCTKSLRGTVNDQPFEPCHPLYLPKYANMCDNNCNSGCTNSCNCKGNSCNATECTRNSCNATTCTDDITLKTLYNQCKHFNKLFTSHPEYIQLIGDILHYLKQDMIKDTNVLDMTNGVLSTPYIGFPSKLFEAYLNSNIILVDDLCDKDGLGYLKTDTVESSYTNEHGKIVDIDQHTLDLIIMKYIGIFMTLARYDTINRTFPTRERELFIDKLENVIYKYDEWDSPKIFIYTKELINSRLVHF